MPFDPEAFEAELEAAGLGKKKEKPSFLTSAWEGVTQPIKALTAGQNVGAQLAGLLSPEAYAAAAKRREEEMGLTPERKAGLYGALRQAEALPGLGDVLAETETGKALGETPFIGRLGGIGKLAGNILGDPLTYAGGVGALTKLGRARGALQGALDVARTTEGLQDAARIAGLAERAREAEAASTGLGRAITAFGRPGELVGGAKAALDPTLGLSERMLGLGRAALSVPTGPLVGAAYAPEILEGVRAGTQETLAEAQAGRPVEALGSAANTALQAGLATLVGKGVIHEWQARKTVARAMQKELPQQAQDQVEPPQPATPQEAAQAVEAGDIPPPQMPLGPAMPGQGGLFPPEQMGIPGMQEAVQQPLPLEAQPPELRLTAPPEAGGPGVQGELPLAPPEAQAPGAQMGLDLGPAAAPAPAVEAPRAAPPPPPPAAPEAAPPPAAPPPPAPGVGGGGVPPPTGRQAELTDAIRAIADAAPEGTELTAKAIAKALRDQGVTLTENDVKYRLAKVAGALEGWERKKGGGWVRKAPEPPVVESAPPPPTAGEAPTGGVVAEPPIAEAPPPPAPPPPTRPAAPAAGVTVGGPWLDFGGKAVNRDSLDHAFSIGWKFSDLQKLSPADIDEIAIRNLPPGRVDLIGAVDRGEVPPAGPARGFPEPPTEAAPVAPRPQPPPPPAPTAAAPPPPRAAAPDLVALRDRRSALIRQGLEDKARYDELLRAKKPIPADLAERREMRAVEIEDLDNQITLAESEAAGAPPVEAAPRAPEPPPPPDYSAAAAAVPSLPAGKSYYVPTTGASAGQRITIKGEIRVGDHIAGRRVVAFEPDGRVIFGEDAAAPRGGPPAEGPPTAAAAPAAPTVPVAPRPPVAEGFAYEEKRNGGYVLKGPQGEHVAGKVYPDRIELTIISKGNAPDSRTAVEALRRFGQERGLPVYFTSPNLSTSGGKFRTRMVERGDLIQSSLPGTGGKKRAYLLKGTGPAEAAAAVAPTPTPPPIQAAGGAAPPGGGRGGKPKARVAQAKATQKAASDLGVVSPAAEGMTKRQAELAGMSREQVLAEQQRVREEGQTDRAEFDRLMAERSEYVPPSLADRIQDRQDELNELSQRLREIDAEALPARPEPGVPKLTRPEREAPKKLTKKQAAKEEATRLRALGGLQEIPRAPARDVAAQREVEALTEDIAAGLSPEEVSRRAEARRAARAAELSTLERGAAPEPVARQEALEPTGEARPRPRPGRETLREPTAERVEPQEYDEETGELIVPKEQAGRRYPFEAPEEGSARFGSPAQPEGFEGPPPIQGLTHAQAREIYGAQRTPEQAANIAEALTGAPQREMVKGAPINWGYDPQSIAGRTVAWMRGSKALDLAQAEAEDILQEKLATLVYGTPSIRNRPLPTPEGAAPDVVAGIKAENEKRAAAAAKEKTSVKAVLDAVAAGDKEAAKKAEVFLRTAIKNARKDYFSGVSTRRGLQAEVATALGVEGGTAQGRRGAGRHEAAGALGQGQTPEDLAIAAQRMEQDIGRRIDEIPGSPKDKDIFTISRRGITDPLTKETRYLTAEQSATVYNARNPGQKPISADTVKKTNSKLDMRMQYPGIEFGNNEDWNFKGLEGKFAKPKGEAAFMTVTNLSENPVQAAQDLTRLVERMTRKDVPRGTPGVHIAIPKGHPVLNSRMFKGLLGAEGGVRYEPFSTRKGEHPLAGVRRITADEIAEAAEAGVALDPVTLLKVKTQEGHDVYRVRRIDRAAATALDDMRARGTNRVASEHLTPDDLQARASAYAGKLDEAVPVMGTDSLAVDFDGDAAGALPGHAKLGPLADALSGVTRAIAEASGHDVRFGGFAPSAHLSGLYFKGGVYANAADAVRWAQGMLQRAGNDSPENVAKVASARLFSTLLHEVNHGAIAGHGPEFAARRLALIKQVLPQVRDAMASIERSIDMGTMAPLVDDLGRRVDVVTGRPEPPPPGRPPAPAPPLPFRPTPEPGGGEGRPSGYPRGGPQPAGAAAGGVRPALGRAEGAPPGAGRPPLPGERARAPGPGEAGAGGRVVPEGPFDQVSESVRTAKDAGDALANSIARGVTPETARDLAAFFKRHDETLKTPLEDWIKAGPQRNVDIPINMNRLDVPEEIKPTVASIVQELHGDRGGPLKWEMIDRQTREMLAANSPDEIVSRLRASGLRTPAQVNAARRIFATYVDNVNTKKASITALQQAGASPGAVAAAQAELGQSMAQLLQAQDVLAPGATTAGRILNTFRMLASPVSEAEGFPGRFKGALRSAGVGKQAAEGLYGMYNDAIAGKITDAAFLDALRKATSPSQMDKVLEFWKAGLLGYPTQIANVTSNAMFQGINRIEEGISAALDALRVGVTGGKRERFLGEVPVRLAAQRKAMSEALLRWKDDMADAATLQPADLDRIMQLGTFDPRRATGAIKGKWGEFVRIPFKSLDAADNFFKYIAEKGEHAARAFRLAQDTANHIPEDGGSAAKAQARILTEMTDAAERPLTSKFYLDYKDQLIAANSAIKRSVFQGPLNESALGRFAKMISQASAAPGFKWLQFLVPFTHTPANILHELTVRTPLGYANVYRKWKNGQFKASGEVMDELAKATFGSVALGGLLGMGMDGTLTGAGPSDPNEQESLKATGWQPYSMHVGDQYVSFQRFEPMASLMGIAADMAEAYKRGEVDKPRELIDRAFASVAENYTNKSFLSGLEGVFSAWHDPRRYFPAFVKQLTGSAVPNVLGAVPVATLARAIDPTFRQTEAFTAGPALARIPGVSTLLPEQLTPLGATRERPGTFAERLLAPFTRTEVKAGPTAEAAREFDRLGWAPRKPERVMKFPDGTRVELTSQELKLMAQAQQKAIEVASKVIRSPEYAMLSDEEDITGRVLTKRDVLQRIVSRYQRAALAQIRGPVMKRGRAEKRAAL